MFANFCAPRRRASGSFSGDVLSIVTSAPNEAAELHRHVPQSSESYDTELMAFANFPVAERRVSGDAGAEQRRDLGGGNSSDTRNTKSSCTTIDFE